MTFEEWVKAQKRPVNGERTMSLMMDAWDAATLAERERIALVAFNKAKDLSVAGRERKIFNGPAKFAAGVMLELVDIIRKG